MTFILRLKLCTQLKFTPRKKYPPNLLVKSFSHWPMIFVVILRPEIMQDLGHTKSHIFYKFWVELAFTNIFQTID